MSNGMAERSVQTMKALIKKAIHDDRDRFIRIQKHLPLAHQFNDLWGGEQKHSYLPLATQNNLFQGGKKGTDTVQDIAKTLLQPASKPSKAVEHRRPCYDANTGW